MFAYTNNLNGIKVFCVHRFDDPMKFSLTSYTRPTMPWDGVSVAGNAYPNILIHEVLHACGLEDIYPYGIDELLLVDETLVGAGNWSGGDGTGYYPPDLTHRTLIRRLLMCGVSNGTQADIPLADLDKPTDEEIISGKPEEFKKRISIKSIRTREPWH